MPQFKPWCLLTWLQTWLGSYALCTGIFVGLHFYPAKLARECCRNWSSLAGQIVFGKTGLGTRGLSDSGFLFGCCWRWIYQTYVIWCSKVRDVRLWSVVDKCKLAVSGFASDYLNYTRSFIYPPNYHSIGEVLWIGSEYRHAISKSGFSICPLVLAW